MIMINIYDLNYLCLTLYHHLVGGLEHVLFSIVYGIILPIDFHIFQRGRYTTNQIVIIVILTIAISLVVIVKL